MTSKMGVMMTSTVSLADGLILIVLVLGTRYLPLSLLVSLASLVDRCHGPYILLMDSSLTKNIPLITQIVSITLMWHELIMASSVSKFYGWRLLVVYVPKL